MGGSVVDLLLVRPLVFTTFAAAISTNGDVSEQQQQQQQMPSTEDEVAGSVPQQCLATTHLEDEMLHLCDQYSYKDDDTMTISLSSPSSLYHYFASLSAATILLLLVSLCLTAAFLYSMIAWYKFLSAWNLILRARQFDNSIQLRRRRRRRHLSSHPKLSMMMQQQQVVHVDTMSKHNLTCPICLVDFFETEFVTSCDDDDNNGCGNWFHRECLVEWLDRSDSCPCCRKNLLFPSQQQKKRQILSIVTDMVRSCFGFVTR